MSRGVVGGALRGHFQSNGHPKKSFPTRKEALAAMNVMKGDPSFQSSKLRALNVFRCEVCDEFHIGHRKARANI